MPPQPAVRALVVDASPGLLDAVLDAIAALRPDWQITATHDAGDAADVIRHTRPDVVAVADSLTGLQPRELLTLAREQAPTAVRLGIVDGAGRLRGAPLVDLAHRLVSRPLDAASVVREVERAMRLAAQLRSERLRAALVRITRLPAAPGLFIDISQVLASGRASTERITDLVRRDPAITARVLQIANSALYARGTKTTDLNAAVLRLGVQTVRNAVLAAETFAGTTPAARERQRRATQASLLAGRLLACAQECQIAATAAVLADVGAILPLELPEQRDDDGLPLQSLAGGFLLTLWGLPERVVEAVVYCEQPALVESDDFGVVGAVHVATALARRRMPDEGYLEAVGVADLLPRWREMMRG